MASISTSSTDPSSMATTLATAYTQNAQTLLTTQTKAAQTTNTALTKLRSALSAFDTALTGLSSKSSVQQYAATFNTTGYATATASSTAQAGTYQVFVEQLASAHQVAYQDLPAVPVASGGPITVNLANGSSFNVNLGAADTDGDGTLSQAEIARAVNQASGNGGKVTAMVVTVGGSSQMVLTSAQSGASGAITLDASALPNSTLKTALSTQKELTAANDAVVWLGNQGSGIKLQQATNTLTAIQGVTLNLTQKMATGAAPLTLTVGSDDSGTASNMKTFIDAYNTLEKTLDDLTVAGSATSSAGAFASDSGVRALRNKLHSLVRQDFGGQRLMDFGVSIDRNGQMSVDNTKLNKALAANPDGLNKVFGKTGLTTSSGLLGGLDTYLDNWTNSASGQIKNRLDGVQKLQKSLTDRQTKLDSQYNVYYERYLAQFTQLQTLQSQMSQTTGLLSNLFTSA